MAYTATYTTRIGIPFFSQGAKYSASADKIRFLYLDYNLESFIGVIDVGIIDGWTISNAGGLSITVGYGTAILMDSFSESPFVVKNHNDVLPTDYVIQYNYYEDYLADSVPEGVYDEELGLYPPAPSGGHDYIYDKVLYSQSISLPDNSDSYVYIYRNSNVTQVTPYYEPNNSSPIPEVVGDTHPLYTAVAFGVTASKGYAQSSGRISIGKVVTRNGEITKIDTSFVQTLKNLEYAITKYGVSLVKSHRHGGSGKYDPAKVILRTDMRESVLETAKEDSATYRILYSDPTSITNGHKHYFSIDDSGDGYTVTTIGSVESHYHSISSYKVASVGTSGGTLLLHDHTLPISEEHPDTWTETEDYQIYINDEPYYGANASVDVDSKVITFSDDVTVVKRKYKLSKTFSDGSTYEFEEEDSSIYRFMLRVALDYYSQNADAISSGSKKPLILPDPESPVTLLKNQCVVAEEQLLQSGDTFTFTGAVAPDPVTVILVEAGHVDKVKIEIVSNSEVSGKLRSQNILYIPADSFSTGTFEVGRIPILSHLGRYLERCEFDSSRAYSYDGYVYQVDDTMPWGNAMVVYSVYVDNTGGYLVGTSDGLYSYPYDGLYLFIVNGERVYLPYGDLSVQLKEACSEYATRTGTHINYDEDIFAPQIELASIELASLNTHYEINGSHKIVNGEVQFDTIHVYRIEGYKLPSFGYEATRQESDVLEGEEVTEIISSGDTETDASATNSSVLSLRTVRVKNDFNKSTVKKLLVETNYTDQYGGVSKMYFALASDFIARTTDPTSLWNLTYQSSLMGYIGDIVRNYKGNYIASTSSGLYVCTSVTSAEYKNAILPTYESSIRAMTFGFGEDILIAYGTNVAISSDYGGSWTESNPTDSDVISLFFDPYRDKTTTNSLHYHSLSIDYAGNGSTLYMYTSSGVQVESTHNHIVSSGEIAESIGHTHTPIRTFFALDRSNVISISVDGISWSESFEIPSTYGEIGIVFACFGYVFVVTQEGTIVTYNDGETWELLSDLPCFYSAQWNAQNDVVYLGAENKVYSYDGDSFTLEKEFNGYGIPSVYIDESRYRFGFTLNNYKRKVDFLGGNQTLSAVDFVYEFNKCYPIHGSWGSGISYDLYVNDKMIKSTHDNVVISEYLKADVSNDGYIDFSVQTKLQDKCSYGDESLNLVDGSKFPESGGIRVSWQGTLGIEYAFFRFVSRTGNVIYLDSPSQYEIDVKTYITSETGTKESSVEVTVDLLSNLGVDDNVLITIYEGKLKNIGINSHNDIEDQLSIQNIGSPKSFADVYVANLMHTTTAVRYAIAEVGDDFKNYFLTIFDYNDIPGDRKNIDRYIDIPASDFFSQVMHSSTFYPLFGTKVSRIIFGFGDFSDVLFVATNIGLYTSKTNLGYEGNWFRVNIDGETIVYDVLQTKDSEVIVCTEKGMYKNANVSLTSWTKFNEDVIGGIPLKINARWSGVDAYNNSDSYWWQGWQGVTHENSNLVNSLFVSGIGFGSVTDDYGVTWQKTYLKDLAGNDIRDSYSLSDMAILHNGTVVSCMKNLDTGRSSVIYATGNGSNWWSVFDFDRYAGRISSYRLTDYGNISITVSYDTGIPPGGSLRGLSLSCNTKEFVIVNNSGEEIVVFGTQIVDAITGGDTFVVNPVTLNSITETPEQSILVGTSNGILTDKGIFLSSADTSSGVVNKVGIRASVVSLNVNGRIKSVVFSNAEKSMISTEIDRIVKQNELKGYKLKVDGFTDMTVISNDSSKSDGSTIMIISCDWTTIPSGLLFVASGENNRIYVDFDSIINPGYLKGGKLYVYPEVSDVTPSKGGVYAFDVINNGTDYIDLKEDPSNESKADWNSLFFTDQVVMSTLPDKTVPLYVNFSQYPSSGTLKGNYVIFREVSSNIEEIQVRISDNTENVVYIPYEFSAETIGADNSTKIDTFVAYNCIFDGDKFVLKNASFESDSSFNLKSSSVVSDHRHDVMLYGKFVTGEITSIGENTSTYVDLNVETISDFNLSPFLGNPSLLDGQDIVMYDPENYSRTYRAHIITATATQIRVTRDDDVFNTSGLDEKKVSAGYMIIIDATMYGTAEEVNFTDNFVIERGYLTDDTFVGGITFYVNSTSGMVPGYSISIKDRDGLSFKTKILSVPSSVSFVTEDASPFDFKTYKDSSYEVLFSVIEVGDIDLTSDSSLGSDSVTVSDTADLLSGDLSVFRDNRGLLFSSKVSNIVNATTFEIEDDFPADFTVANGSHVEVTRYNYENVHSHMIKAGEFSQVENAEWHGRGYSFSHSHVVSPYIKEVYDIEVVHSKILAVGNESKIYYSNNSGSTWSEYVELKDVDNEPPESVQIIVSNGNDLLFGADKRIVFHSTVIRSEAVPLEKPIG